MSKRNLDLTKLPDMAGIVPMFEKLLQHYGKAAGNKTTVRMPITEFESLIQYFHVLALLSTHPNEFYQFMIRVGMVERPFEENVGRYIALPGRDF